MDETELLPLNSDMEPNVVTAEEAIASLHGQIEDYRLRMAAAHAGLRGLAEILAHTGTGNPVAMDWARRTVNALTEQTYVWGTEL